MQALRLWKDESESMKSIFKNALFFAVILLTCNKGLAFDQYVVSTALLGTWVSSQDKTKVMTVNKDGTASLIGDKRYLDLTSSKWTYYHKGNIAIRLDVVGPGRQFVFYLLKGIDEKIIESTIFLSSFPTAKGETTKWVRKTPVPDWLKPVPQLTSDDINGRSEGLPPLKNKLPRKQFCNPALLYKGSIEPSDRRRGPVTLVAQNASTLFCASDHFEIHERGNYLPSNINKSGPARCSVRTNRNGHKRTTSHLVAIIDKPRSFMITRRWMWDNLRLAIRNEVLPEICPTADDAILSVYLKGFDTTSTGEIYKTAEVSFPKINRPTYTRADAHDTGLIAPVHGYNQMVNQFISRGILLVIFKGPAYKSKSCERSSTDCSYDTFSPSYFGPTGGFSAISHLRQQLIGSSNVRTRRLLEKIREYKERLDGTNFNNFAEYTRERHESNENTRKHNEEITARIMKLYKFKQKILDLDAREFWAIFASAFKNGGVWDEWRCDNAMREGNLNLSSYCKQTFGSE